MTGWDNLDFFFSQLQNPPTFSESWVLENKKVAVAALYQVENGNRIAALTWQSVNVCVLDLLDPWDFPHPSKQLNWLSGGYFPGHYSLGMVKGVQEATQPSYKGESA